MAGKSTTRARRRPALAHWVAPHSNHAPPAVGRTRGEIHRGPIGNSRPAAKGKAGSIALARAKPVGLAAHRKVASEAEAVISLAVEAAAGLIASVPAQVAPGASVAVGSDGGKKRVSSIECRGTRRRRGEGRVSGVEGNSLDPHPSTLDPRELNAD